MSELKPCPCCNSKRNLMYVPGDSIQEKNVTCDFCGVQIHENNWNTRPIEDALMERIQELEAKLAVLIAERCG